MMRPGPIGREACRGLGFLPSKLFVQGLDVGLTRAWRICGRFSARPPPNWLAAAELYWVPKRSVWRTRSPCLTDDLSPVLNR